jgi:hypothetical protein
MYLSKDEISEKFNIWLVAWDNYNLDAVMELMRDDVVFENWNGSIIQGKKNLRRAWTPWFLNHGNFKFIKEDIFIDDQQQKLVFRWCLEWPSLEVNYKRKPEIRRGIDIVHFLDGKIILKLSYSKTVIQIDSNAITLQAI